MRPLTVDTDLRKIRRYRFCQNNQMRPEDSTLLLRMTFNSSNIDEMIHYFSSGEGIMLRFSRLPTKFSFAPITQSHTRIIHNES